MVVDGEVVDTFGAPGLVIAGALPRFDPSVIVDGRDPVRPGEATVVQQNAEDHGIDDRRRNRCRHPPRRQDDDAWSGSSPIGEGGSALGGATVIELTPLGMCEHWFDLQGSVVLDQRHRARRRRSGRALGASVAAACPLEPRARRPPSENSAETADEINDQIGSF